jgi:CBS domain-containing protein
VRPVGHDKIYEVTPRELLHDVLLEMVRRSLDAAMVVVNDHLVGILTATDACKLRAEHLRASYERQ